MATRSAKHASPKGTAEPCHDSPGESAKGVTFASRPPPAAAGYIPVPEAVLS